MLLWPQLFLIPHREHAWNWEAEWDALIIIPKPTGPPCSNKSPDVSHTLKTLRPLRDLIHFKNTGYTASGHSPAFTTNCSISCGDIHFPADRQLSGKPKSRQREAECKSELQRGKLNSGVHVTDTWTTDATHMKNKAVGASSPGAMHSSLFSDSAGALKSYRKRGP